MEALNRSELFQGLAQSFDHRSVEACDNWADCKALLDAGTDIDFQGVTGPVDFNEYGDLAQGTIEVNEYTSNTEFESLGKITADVPLP